jgi:hypothetical protein
VNGSSLVIKTASGQPVTVTTTAATKVGESGASGALLSDITDGASVTVVGPGSDGTVAAFSVIIDYPAQHQQPQPGMVVVKGDGVGKRSSGDPAAPARGPQLHISAQVQVKNCSPASIDNALAFGG